MSDENDTLLFPAPRPTANGFPRPDDSASDDLLRGQGGERLSVAIDRLYAAFEGATLEQPFSYCSHCFDDSDATYFTEKPLRALTCGDVASILCDLTLTFGSDGDVNYFLPRLLEALAYQAHYMAFVLPDRLKKARAQGWSEPQIAAVVGFFVAYVNAVNALDCNTGLVYELEDELLDELKEVLPELPRDLCAQLNDPGVVGPTD